MPVICIIHIVTNMAFARQRICITRSRDNEQTQKSTASQWLAKHTFPWQRIEE
jgi:hypothetical protein